MLQNSSFFVCYNTSLPFLSLNLGRFDKIYCSPLHFFQRFFCVSPNLFALSFFGYCRSLLVSVHTKPVESAGPHSVSNQNEVINSFTHTFPGIMYTYTLSHLLGTLYLNFYREHRHFAQAVHAISYRHILTVSILCTKFIS